MARVTRSRKINIAEDNTAFPEPFNPQFQHPTALVEINHTMPVTPEDATLAVEVKGLKAAYRNAIGNGKRGKKAKGKRKGKQDHIVEGEENHEDAENAHGTGIGTVQLVPEFNQHLDTSVRDEQLFHYPIRVTRNQAAKQAGQYASSTSIGAHLGMSQMLRNSGFLSFFGGRPIPRAPIRLASYGTFMTDHQLFLAEEALSESVNSSMGELAHEESSVSSKDVRDTMKQPIPTITPVKTLEVERVEVAVGPLGLTDEEEGDDSFVQEIIARSPAKPVSRIEDSVEALDQLEEALEALDEAALAERILSPEKARKPVTKQISDRGVDKAAGKQSSSSMTTKPGHASVRVKPTAPRQSVVKKATSMVFKPTVDKVREDPKSSQPIVRTTTKRPMSLVQKEPAKSTMTKRPVSLIMPKGPVKSSKPTTKADFELPGEAVARRLKAQREARLAQRQSSIDSTAPILAPKIKSTKPLTKPAFELPGEALSRKKKEEHEARLKAQEEEERKRREFKAKPVRSSVLPSYLPRDTAASRARQSKVGFEVEDGNLTVSKRGSNVGAHRPSIAQLNMANTSAPRAPGPATTRKPSPAIAPVSMNGLPPHLQRTVSASEVHMQRQRGKEIYNRDAKLVEDMEREKREREVAAKRAREEAAERGRQASREWAEKQLAKKLADGDQGMGAGFGAGGQLGLKA